MTKKQREEERARVSESLKFWNDKIRESTAANDSEALTEAKANRAGALNALEMLSERKA